MSDSSSLGSGLMVVLGGLLLIGALYVLLSSNAEDPATASTATTSVPDSVNTLTDAEREAGWRLLFDGTSLDGWRGYQRDSIPGGWTVEDEAIHFEGEGPNSTTMITADTYDHFELRIEWKIAPESNSGIMYRVTESAETAYRTGPEYQIIDNAVLDSTAGPKHQTGALYGLYAPPEDVARPVGQYNETRIVVRGAHVEHWLNGTKLLEAEIGSDTWKQRVAGTKFADWPEFAQATDGHIALQDHGHPVWFRDVKLRPLTPES